MRTFKLLISILFLAFIGLFFWQNLPAFKTTLPFSLNLYFREQMNWTHQLYTLLLIAGGLGFLLGFLLMLKPYFNVRRLLAQERLEREQERMPQPASPPPAPPSQEETDEKTDQAQ